MARILLWLLLIVLLRSWQVRWRYAYYVARSALAPTGWTTADQRIVGAGYGHSRQHGVPTIEAASLEDLFFAQGYVTAQDRLWQMDVMRRFASGELSEILGERHC